MKLSMYFIFLTYLMLIIFPAEVLPQPYWVEPGVYITYIASRYDPYFETVKGATPEQIHTAELYYTVNGTLFRIFANNDTYVRFEFIKVEKGYATVRVAINMSNVTISTIFLNGTKSPIFWNSGDVMSEKLLPSHEPGFEDCVWLEVKLEKIILSGTYKIRLEDGAVFGMNGTYYGKTFLWFDSTNPPNVNESIAINKGMETTVWKVGTLNRSMMTYYGKFGPPLFSVLYSTENTKFYQKIDSERTYPLMEISFGGPSAGIVYDPSTEIAIYPTIIENAPYSDFYAVGIQWAQFTDEKSAYNLIVKKDKSWGTGLILYDTNAEFDKVETVEYPKPQTLPAYFFYGLLFVLMTAVLTFKRWR